MSSSNLHIVDLPRPLDAAPILDQIKDGLLKPQGQRTLPTIILYDEQGLRLYDEITTKAPEYYLFGCEESILRDHAPDIVRVMHGGPHVREGEVVLELGAGALRKTSHILRALANFVGSAPSPRPISYLALDLERSELERTLSDVAQGQLGPILDGRVQIGGLCGTYDDGLEYVRGGGLLEERSTSSLSSLPTPSDDPATITQPDLSLASKALSAERDGERPDQQKILRVPSPRPASRKDSFVSSSSSSGERRSDFSSVKDSPPLHLLFLGSSIGNFTPEGAADFLRGLPLRPWESTHGDTLLLGLDHDNDPKTIELAYNDPAGHTRRFILNGLEGIRRALQQANAAPTSIDAFDQSNWDYLETYNLEKARHEGHYITKHNLAIRFPSGELVEFAAGETVHVESSYKYSEQAAQALFTSANLQPIQRWTSDDGLYSLWLLRRPSFSFPILPSVAMRNSPTALHFPVLDASTPKFSTVPTLDEWQSLWSLWDTVTLGMIPKEMLMQKPIDLRHKCLFYLGHIPTFLDIHLSKLLKEPHTEPEYFKDIFERGIDPHVDDPSQCHPHSEVPDDDESWPNLEIILQFRDRVRERVKSVYALLDSGDLERRGLAKRKVQRVLWMTFEHEAFHIETLLYMLIQRAGETDGTKPPPGIPIPDWTVLAREWSARQATEAALNQQLTLGPTELEIGHNDSERQDLAVDEESSDHEFGWDNEHPRRVVQVGKFKIDRLPITNGEYLAFWKAKAAGASAPKSWVVDGDEVKVRTLFGPVPMSIAQGWPLMASFDELEAFAKNKGGRIPTEPELRLFMDDQSSRGIVQHGAGWGFQRWWLEPPSLGNPARKIAPHNGGVWEWSSTLLDKYQGFEPSVLYPGYSADFFDGVHHVVLGGSFATLPRLAQRRSVRNYYQHNYPYAWVGARVAYDA